ncbi:MAG TPA: hypothetical protein VHQ97_00445 [Solirubrobacterales bacterium]|jgi:hypothetical protein|nr:hypothetical protein [Solirubrobacterales bacterium]
MGDASMITGISPSSARRAVFGTIALLLALLAGGVLAGPALAEQKILDYKLESNRQDAGAHPDIEASFELESPGEPEIAREVGVHLPTGVFGNPGAILRCSAAEFALNHCAPGAQAGVITIFANYEGNPNHIMGTAPVYNMERQSENESGRLAFVAPTVKVPIIMPISVRSGSDYGLTMNIQGIPQSVPLSKVRFEVWGFPADHEHDSERFPAGDPGSPPGCAGLTTTGCIPGPFPEAGAALLHPFINNPTVCTGSPLRVSLKVTTYQDPTHPSEAHADFPPTSECEHERFDPSLNVGLTTGEADAPSGLDLQLKSDQFLAAPPSPSELRSAVVTLPEGLSVNPDAADGQLSCTDQQANFNNDAAGQCPDNSKIGTFDVRTPAIEGPLVGSLYIGQPLPGNQYRIFMIADGFGVHVKFVASVHPNPRTGQLTWRVTDLPQVPFAEFNLHLFSSDRGLIATPTRCGIYEADSVFTPWNSELAPQHSRPILSVDEGPNKSSCPGLQRPFHPRLVAGTSNPAAGAFSDFHLRLDREDGDQFLGDLNFVMPPGLTARLRGLTYCPEGSIVAAANNQGRAERASPSCPASSEIGTTNVAAGPGHHPFHAVGRMYLAGPFKGAPLSLVAVTPALAGPYDYGVVVVRVAIHIDPLDAHVTALSDTVPSIIGGIPIRMRSIQVNVDKPNFMVNPTNCSPFSVDSQGVGDQGTVADFSSYFQSVDCETLPFKPRMSIRQIGGRKQTKRSRNPALRFDLRTRGGEANIKSLAVTLPKAFAIDQRHLGNICSRAELVAKHCAGRQPIGTAETHTPLLDAPLKGPAYAVSGFGKLPHVAFILAGQVTIIPEAESSSVKGHLRTVVPVIPDAPIGHFRLNLLGGKQGYLVNTRQLCATPAVAKIQFKAQNGKRLTRRVKVKTACSRPAAKKRRR